MVTWTHIVGTNLYSAYSVGGYLGSFTNEIFIIVLAILPYFLCAARLLFFAKQFDENIFVINPRIHESCSAVSDLRQQTGKFIKIAIICESIYYFLSLCATLTIIGSYPQYVCSLCLCCLCCLCSVQFICHKYLIQYVEQPHCSYYHCFSCFCWSAFFNVEFDNIWILIVNMEIWKYENMEFSMVNCLIWMLQQVGLF